MCCEILVVIDWWLVASINSNINSNYTHNHIKENFNNNAHKQFVNFFCVFSLKCCSAHSRNASKYKKIVGVPPQKSFRQFLKLPYNRFVILITKAFKLLFYGKTEELLSTQLTLVHFSWFYLPWHGTNWQPCDGFRFMRIKPKGLWLGLDKIWYANTVKYKKVGNKLSTKYMTKHFQYKLHVFLTKLFIWQLYTYQTLLRLYLLQHFKIYVFLHYDIMHIRSSR